MFDGKTMPMTNKAVRLTWDKLFFLNEVNARQVFGDEGEL